MKKIIFCLFVLSPAFASDDLIQNDIVSGCGNAYLYSAVFEKNIYKCSPGYYLPAGGELCEVCPNNHICEGGTFSYSNIKTQGLSDGNILVTNAVGSCLNNFSQNFKAVFEPNIITLNWNDGTNITTTQCTFGETITIPNPPTRPGYKFGGWRVKRRN